MPQKTYVLDTLEDEKFVSLMSVLDTVTKEDKLVMYVDSFGGPQSYFCMVSDRLNSMVDDGFDVSLVISVAGSMALQLAYEFKGKKTLARFCEGLAHTVAQGGSDVYYVNGETRIRTSDPMRLGRQKEDAKREPFHYPFLTEEENARYLEGLDVYLSETRMLEIFGNNA